LTLPVSFNKDGIPVYEPHRASDIDPFNSEQALASEIPAFDNWRKTDFLSYQAMGFSVRESCVLAGVTQGNVKRWRREDSNFAEWCFKVPAMQKDISATLLSRQFSRNMHMALKLDSQIIQKAVLSPQGIEDLTESEQKYLQRAADRYKTTDLLAMLKVLEPEREAINVGETNINVYVDGIAVTGVEAEKAAARQLLQKFTANHDAIEATSRIIDRDDASSSQ